jgi:hypothetical protein
MDKHLDSLKINSDSEHFKTSNKGFKQFEKMLIFANPILIFVTN